MAHFRDLCTKHMEISFLQKRDKTLVVWSFLGVEISKVFVHGGGGGGGGSQSFFPNF